MPGSLKTTHHIRAYQRGNRNENLGRRALRQHILQHRRIQVRWVLSVSKAKADGQGLGHCQRRIHEGVLDVSQPRNRVRRQAGAADREFIDIGRAQVESFEKQIDPGVHYRQNKEHDRPHRRQGSRNGQSSRSACGDRRTSKRVHHLSLTITDKLKFNPKDIYLFSI